MMKTRRTRPAASLVRAGMLVRAGAEFAGLALGRFTPLRLARFGMALTVLSWAAAVGCGGGGNNQPDGIGNSCQEDADCMTGNCYVGPGGGYCTTDCENEGSTAECPVDTVCKPIQGGPARCLLVCGSDTSCDGKGDCADDFCPDGSGCVDVSETDLKACEPDP